MDLQQLLSYVRRACDDYHMIQANDSVAVAVSGGKDSLAVLAALAALRRFYPKPFTLSAITIDLGFDGFDLSPVADYCQTLEVPYTILKTDIAEIVFDVRQEKNPCSLCAKMRKGALNAEAAAQGVKRVVYGHNKDDFLHTFFMSLLFEGRISTLNPVTFWDRSGVYCIRPLLYTPEQDIIGFVRRYGLPVLKSPCPADGHTKRAEIRQLTADLRQRYTHFDDKVFGAIKRSLL